MKLHSYKNGPNDVEIHDDGTKIRYWRGPAKFPDHADIKITNWCDAGCPYCFEMSTKRGKYGNIDLILRMWQNLPAGAEIAVGGGSTLDHPEILKLLEVSKLRGHICNVTVNQLHLEKNAEILRHIVKNDLVKGIGLSVRDVAGLKGEILDYPHIVFHLIAGVHSYADFVELRRKIPNAKCLILGYKEFGFGLKKSKDLSLLKESWRKNLPRLMTGGGVVSFDNLAIRQLNLRKYFGEEEWNSLYMGDDGEFSLYVDAVEEKFGLNSCAVERFPIAGRNVEECFQSLKKEVA